MGKQDYTGEMILPEGTESNLSLFIREAAGHPLLTKAEEAELYRRLDEIWPTRLQDKNTPIPAQAQPIVTEIAAHNFRLVLGIAKKMKPRDMPLAEIVQEGNCGLVTGILRFDAKKGVRISTYVTRWIQQAIGRAIMDQRDTIRRPVHAWDMYTRIRRYTDEIEQAGKSATNESIAARFENQTTPDKVSETLELFRQSETESLDKDRFDFYGGEANGYQMIPDDRVDISASSTYYDLRSVMTQVLETLPVRHKKVIELRYGLNGHCNHTLEEVGQKFGLTRERIRQLESEALRKLRHPRRSRSLKDFTD